MNASGPTSTEFADCRETDVHRHAQPVGRNRLAQSEQTVILIVEDEFLIRMDAVHMIRSAGFDVVEAENADEAILILERRFDITIVFTDVQMPGSMNGLKLAAAIRGRWPPIKIVATSGLMKIDQDDLPSGSHFLPKPYSASQIVEVLRALTAEC
jgi:two-component system, response regulator PdtaR